MPADSDDRILSRLFYGWGASVRIGGVLNGGRGFWRRGRRGYRISMLGESMS